MFAFFQNISCLGTDDWYDFLTNNSYSKHKAVGKCHIRLGISYKQVINVNSGRLVI